MRAQFIVTVVALFLLSAAVPTSSAATSVEMAFHKLQDAFSNVTRLTTSPGLGAYFAANGTWCAEAGSPCQTTPAVITAFITSFANDFKFVAARAVFTDLYQNNNVGSFVYTKTFTCQNACGSNTCLVPGRSAFEVDRSTGLVMWLDDFVDNTAFLNLCVAPCTCKK